MRLNLVEIAQLYHPKGNSEAASAPISSGATLSEGVVAGGAGAAALGRALRLGREVLRPVLAPRAADAGAGAAPPVVDVAVVLARHLGVVQQRAQPTEEVRVDELAGALPPEVLIVQVVVGVQPVQVGGQLARRRELVHVDVRLERRALLVVLGTRAHHNWNYVVAAKKSYNLLKVFKFY